ncbi:MAG: anaerobic ribonucleoside-triphosphate reductase activating protein [Desulfobacterales bacterium]|jgi:pyruvate formate lyase activating enzyme
MVLGGLQKNSLIDYPGKLSCVLFFAGCNFNCPFCHNPDLVKSCRVDPHLLSENELYRFLKNRRTVLDGIVISGGEPTLQRQLFSYCAKIKRLGYPLKLDTNGSRPHVIQRLLDRKLVDYVAMDIKTDPSNYSPTIYRRRDPTRILSSIKIIMDSAPDYEFRTTCVKPLVNERVIDKISRIIEGAKRYVLQRFHSVNVLHPEYFRSSTQVLREDELLRLKTIAAPRVAECMIR